MTFVVDIEMPSTKKREIKVADQEMIGNVKKLLTGSIKASVGAIALAKSTLENP